MKVITSSSEKFLFNYINAISPTGFETEGQKIWLDYISRFVDETDLDKTEEWFDRRANTAVLICRCIPLMRSLISSPAGFRRMPLVPFTIFTLAGSLVWNVLLIGAGYLLGEQWNKVEAPLELFQALVLLVIGLALAWFIWRKIVRPRLRGAAG